MAYGMSPEELAKVGNNVKKNGGTVDEGSIAAAMDQELSDDRKKQVGKFKKRKESARSEDAKNKAELKSNLVKAIVDSGVKGAGAAADAGAFSKKPKTPDIAPVQVKAGMKDNLVSGKPEPRVQTSGFTPKGPDMRSKEYMKQKSRELRELKRMGRRSKGDGTAETDSELLSIYGS